MRYQGPEQRSRRLPESLSRVQHGYGSTRRVSRDPNTRQADRTLEPS